jgi:hypothetical protein
MIEYIRQYNSPITIDQKLGHGDEYYHEYYHYSLGSKRTTDKLQAILWANEKNEWIHFHMPQWLKDLPIHIEPQESMKELCVKRAQSIRESNNYIKLWFSGGCDSTYMLKIFVECGIHIDEIVCMKCGIPEADWEIDQVALPFLKSIKSKISQTKITVKVPTMADYKNFYKNDYWFENYKNSGRNSKAFMGIRISEHLEAIKNHNVKQSSVNVLGLDKPFINYVNGEWFAFTLDYNVQQQVGTKDNTCCSFYNDDPLIYIKQCHMLKRGIVSRVQNVSDYNKVCLYADRYQDVFNESIGRVDHGYSFIKKSQVPTDTKFIGLNRKESTGKEFIAKNFPEIFKKYTDGIQNLNAIQNGRWFHDNNAEAGTIGIFAEFKSLDRNSTKIIDELYPDGFKP